MITGVPKYIMYFWRWLTGDTYPIRPEAPGRAATTVTHTIATVRDNQQEEDLKAEFRLAMVSQAAAAAAVENPTVPETHRFRDPEKSEARSQKPEDQ